MIQIHTQTHRTLITLSFSFLLPSRPHNVRPDVTDQAHAQCAEQDGRARDLVDQRVVEEAGRHGQPLPHKTRQVILD